MRLVVGFAAFDLPHEQENMGFHDTPKASLAGEPLMMTEKQYQSNPELVGRILEKSGMTLEVVSLEVYGQDIEPTDTFMVLDPTDSYKVWFGYWEPSGCKFLRDRGVPFPYCWVNPQILDTLGNVIRPGAEPGIIADTPNAARMLGCDVEPGDHWPTPKEKLEAKIQNLDACIEACDIGRNFWCGMTRLSHQSMVSNRNRLQAELDELNRSPKD